MQSGYWLWLNVKLLGGSLELQWKDEIFERDRNHTFALNPAITNYFNKIEWVHVLVEGYYDLVYIFFFRGVFSLNGYILII